MDDSVRDADTQAIRALNDKISRDGRVHSYLAPVGDGLYMAYKR
jgi:predicted O-methyltransferase YrrM